MRAYNSCDCNLITTDMICNSLYIRVYEKVRYNCPFVKILRL